MRFSRFPAALTCSWPLIVVAAAQAGSGGNPGPISKAALVGNIQRTRRLNDNEKKSLSAVVNKIDALFGVGNLKAPKEAAFGTISRFADLVGTGQLTGHNYEILNANGIVFSPTRPGKKYRHDRHLLWFKQGTLVEGLGVVPKAPGSENYMPVLMMGTYTPSSAVTTLYESLPSERTARELLFRPRLFSGGEMRSHSPLPSAYTLVSVKTLDLKNGERLVGEGKDTYPLGSLEGMRWMIPSFARSSPGQPGPSW